MDKGGNSARAILDCIETGAALLRSNLTVIVVCDFGVSRSNSIAAGILSRAENCSFDGALARVLAATGESEIKLDMIESVRDALSPKVSPDTNETVLLTGGSGFIGRRLSSRLSECRRVATPSRESLNLLDGPARLASYCRTEGVGQIVHLAYPRVYTNIGAMAQGLTMLRTVLDACKLLGIRLIFVSSTVVYGGYKAESLMADESLPFRPKGTYGDAKFLEEMLVAAYASRGEVVHSVCRLAPVYGPGGERPRFIKNFKESILAGKLVQTHRYLNARPALDLLFVDDAADAIAETARSSSNEIFHFGSGTLHTTAMIAESVAKILNKPLKAEELPIEDYVANIQMDATKAQAMLGWRPSTSLEEGLARTLMHIEHHAED